MSWLVEKKFWENILEKYMINYAKILAATY